MKVYIVIEDTGNMFEPDMSIYGVYKSEEEADAVAEAKGKDYWVDDWKLIE